MVAQCNAPVHVVGTAAVVATRDPGFLARFQDLGTCRFHYISRRTLAVLGHHRRTEVVRSDEDCVEPGHGEDFVHIADRLDVFELQD